MFYTATVRGQSSTEYAFALAMVTVVCLGALWYFGDELLSGMTGMRAQMSGDSSATVAQAPIPTNPVPVAAGQPVPPAPAYPGAPNLTATLANGQIVSLPGYPDDIEKLVETAGSNGATEALLAQLDSLIAQMKAIEPVDTEQINRLQELSAQGHRIANIEKLLEDSVMASEAYTTSVDKMIPFDGKTYLFTDLASLIGYAAWPDQVGPPLSSQNPYSTSSELRTFVDLYTEAVNSGTLNDPAVHDIVTDAATKIAIVAETTEHMVNTMHGQVDEKAYFKEYSPSTTTYMESRRICEAGGGPTVSCKPAP
ncbi:MAG: hypothetical protein AB7P76_07210 [Candidatus Melainabacteria bacterium]